MTSVSMPLLIVIAIVINSVPAVYGESRCLEHYKELGEERAGAVLGAISGAMNGGRETIIGNGYTVSVFPKGRCSVDIRMEDDGKTLVCSESVTICMDDLPQEEVDRLRLRYAQEELERKEQLLRFEEESKARWEERNREKERAREEHQKQLLERVPGEYLENPERYLPIMCKDYHVELKNVRSCQKDSECGQILAGTSCGCTRNLVARKNADLAKYLELRKTALALLSITSTFPDACSDFSSATPCDCPEADGFLCVDNICKWNYIPKMTVPGAPESPPVRGEH